MSHDRGCFRCGDDPPYTDCKRADCPKRPEPGNVEHALLMMAAARITELAQNARSVVFDRPKPLDCRILKGKYKGRLARVDGVIACERRGLLYLAYVYKLVRKGEEYVPSKEYLNSDGESRQYRPLEEIEILWA